MGVSSISNVQAWAAVLMIAALKLDAKVVVGFPSTTEVSLALARGELQIDLNGDYYNVDQVAKGILKLPLLTVGDQKSKLYPDVPLLQDTVKLTPELQGLYDLILAMKTGSKVVGATPGVPVDRLKFLRDTFDKMMQDPAFVKDMERILQVWTPPIRGEDMNHVMMEPMLKNVPKMESYMAFIKSYTAG